MDTIVLANQKGGTCKTTTATNLAVVSSRHDKTLLIDLDEQASAAKWWQRREDESPQLVRITLKELPEALNLAEREGYQRVFIDTAGHQSLSNNEAIRAATFCLVPCQPSVADITAVYPTVDALNRMDKTFAFVLTRCPAVGRDEVSAREGLSGLGLVAKPFTGERKAYKHAFAMGESVVEYDPKDKAAQEMVDLYQWLNRKIKKLGL